MRQTNRPGDGPATADLGRAVPVSCLHLSTEFYSFLSPHRMNPLLRSWARTASGVVFVSLLLGGAPGARAQPCPIAPLCTPGRASNSQAGGYNMGIFNVTVGGSLINRTSVGQSEGYQDLGCTLNATLVVGQAYAISVRTNPNGAENVRVYVDYNNDGNFTGNNELVYQDISGVLGVPPNAGLHTGSFTPPAPSAGGPALGTKLRLRVAADDFYSPLPTSCSTPVYSQVEDYAVTLAANASPPVAAFTTSGTTTCTGCVQFTDASQNLPTAWLWTFGDGSTSPAQNPNKCYATAGTYAVTLRATNAAGNNTTTATSITYNASVPVAAACTPATLNYFANYGITRFQLNTIDNTSANGSAGYQDFTCPQRTELIAGVNYPMTITTGGTNAHDIRVYLDKNNDGILVAGDLVYQGLNVASPGATATLNLPAGTTLNQPLRLRVVADAVGSAFGPCTNQASGQAEDYTVIARPNTLPPSINFTSNYVAGGCVNPIQFTDLSTNLPTAWSWDFGDGTALDTRQNPSHSYAATGTYSVSLSATNTNGTASITRLGYVTVTVPCLLYCPSNGFGGFGPGGVLLSSPFFITGVSVANAQPTFTRASGVATGGYSNFTAPPITMAAGTPVNLTVVTNLGIVHRVSVWVDYSRNGTFEPNELMTTGLTPNGPGSATYTASFSVPVSTPALGLSARMRVQVAANNTPSAVCGVNIFNGEVEDYQLLVGPLAARDAQALPALALYPNPTPDGRLRLHLPDARAAGLYAAAVENLLGATVLRTALRLGPAADAELDLRALAPGVYVLRLRDAQGQTALRRVVRE